MARWTLNDQLALAGRYGAAARKNARAKYRRHRAAAVRAAEEATRRHEKDGGTGMKCDGITQAARTCRRPATVIVELHGGRRLGYCTQHAGGAGAMKLLRPFPWDVARILRVAK